MGRRKGLPIDGVLLLDKPRGLSSNTALQRARRAVGAAKAGHTGTLDPMASGLLPVAFGEATKFSQYLLDADKVYLAEVCLGIITDTGDAEGKEIARSERRPSPEEIRRACRQFVGELDQVPPMYSALKREGRSLYEYAREGIEVERQPRRVTIRSIEVVAMAEDRFRCRVHCSKGTYIRVLAEDIGTALGCGAHLTALEREATGPFELKDAIALAEFDAMDQDARLSALRPADSFVGHLPVLDLSAGWADRICHGQGVDMGGTSNPGLRRLYVGVRFLGLGSLDETGFLTPVRLLAT